MLGRRQHLSSGTTMQSVFSARRRILATTCETSASRPETKRQRPHRAGEQSLTSCGPLTATDPEKPFSFFATRSAMPR